MFKIFLEAIWFFLPALSANVAPVLASRFNWHPHRTWPIDGYLLIRGKRLLGDHKTTRGLLWGIAFGSITGFIQFCLFDLEYIKNISLILYDSPVKAILIGALIGFGALLGDAIKSSIKRQLGFMPGEAWQPWDQIDIVFGVFLVSSWLIPQLTLLHLVVITFSVWIVMYISSLVGVKLGIKDSI